MPAVSGVRMASDVPTVSDILYIRLLTPLLFLTYIRLLTPLLFLTNIRLLTSLLFLTYIRLLTPLLLLESPSFGVPAAVGAPAVVDVPTSALYCLPELQRIRRSTAIQQILEPNQTQHQILQ